MTLVLSKIFDDTELLSHALRHTNVTSMQLSRGRFEGVLTQFSIDKWSFQHVAFHAATVTCSGDSPSIAESVLVPLEFHPQSSILGKRVNDTTLALYGKRSEHADVSLPGVRHMVITVQDDAIRMPASSSQTVQTDPQSARTLKVLLDRLQGIAETRPDAFVAETAKRGISDELTTALTAAVTLPEHRDRVGRPELPRRSIVGRIRDVLAVNEGEPIFTDELCKAAGVSVPTLRRVFLDWYGIPPARYLLLRRFYLARARLRSGQARTVRDAAESCGFWELSRFAAGYRALFGELPSQAIGKRSRKGE